MIFSARCRASIVVWRFAALGSPVVGVSSALVMAISMTWSGRGRRPTAFLGRLAWNHQARQSAGAHCHRQYVRGHAGWVQRSRKQFLPELHGLHLFGPPACFLIDAKNATARSGLSVIQDRVGYGFGDSDLPEGGRELRFECAECRYDVMRRRCGEYQAGTRLPCCPVPLLEQIEREPVQVQPMRHPFLVNLRG